MRFSLLLVVPAALLLGGCATTTVPVVVGGGTTGLPELAGSYPSVLVLPPHVSWESQYSGGMSGSSAASGGDAAFRMSQAATEGLASAGFVVLHVDSVDAAVRGSVQNAAARIVEEGPVLVSEYKDKTPLIPVLGELGALTGAHLVCIQTLGVKMGSSSSWNMNTGAIAQGTSSSAVRTVLVRADNGAEVWRNSCLVRDLPAGKAFDKTVRAMFPAPRRSAR